MTPKLDAEIQSITHNSLYKNFKRIGTFIQQGSQYQSSSPSAVCSFNWRTSYSCLLVLMLLSATHSAIAADRSCVGKFRVFGDIGRKYDQLGACASILGAPTTSETPTPDSGGRYNHFKHGSIYWSPKTGAHVIYGEILKRWSSIGWERSFLGYPTSDEQARVGGGRVSHFQGGWSIEWTQTGGTRFVHADQKPEARRLNPGAYLHLKRMLTRMRTKHGIPAIGAGTVAKGEVFAYGASGFRSGVKSISVSDHDLFAIGSVTKTVTGFLVANLIEDSNNRISWTTTIKQLFNFQDALVPLYRQNQSISQISTFAANIPFLQLSHASCSINKFNFTVGDAMCASDANIPETCKKDNVYNYRFCGREEFVKKVLRSKVGAPRNNMPNDPVVRPNLYNNNNPVLISAMLQKAFGLTYEELLRHHVLFPLNMNARFISDITKTEVTQDLIPIAATGPQYARFYGYATDNTNYHVGHASGGLMLSPKAMAQYLREFTETGVSTNPNRLLSNTSLDTLFGGLNNATQRANGGWFLGNFPQRGKPTWWHNGATSGFHANFVVVPKLGMGVGFSLTGIKYDLNVGPQAQKFNEMILEITERLLQLVYKNEIQEYFLHDQTIGNHPLSDKDLLTNWQPAESNPSIILANPSQNRALHSVALAYPPDHNITKIKIYRLHANIYHLVKELVPNTRDTNIVSFPNIPVNSIKIALEHAPNTRPKLTEVLFRSR